MFVILMTTMFYKALILQGEIWCWSLLGVKGLKGLHHAICYIFSKLRRVFASFEFQKGTILLFKTTRYVGVETVSCCLFPRMTGMEMH